MTIAQCRAARKRSKNDPRQRRARLKAEARRVHHVKPLKKK